MKDTLEGLTDEEKEKVENGEYKSCAYADIDSCFFNNSDMFGEEWWKTFHKGLFMGFDNSLKKVCGSEFYLYPRSEDYYVKRLYLPAWRYLNYYRLDWRDASRET